MDILNEFLSPVMDGLGNFMPDFVGAIVILLVGWLVAKACQKGSYALIEKSGLTARMGADSSVNIERIVSRFIYYLVLFFVLVFVLNSLGYDEVLDPIKSMYESLLSSIPNIIAAGFIGLVGYMLARIVGSLVEIAGDGAERLMARAGVTGIDLSKILHIVVFLLIFVPALLAAFEKLNISVISEPATEMLQAILAAIPRILAAAVILLVAFVGGRILSSLTTQTLTSVGADTLPSRFGAAGVFERTSFSSFIGALVFFFILLSAAVTASERMEFTVLSVALNQVLTFAGSILVGLVILAVGNWLANMAYNGLNNAGSNLAPIARFAILGLVLAMGLRAMGLADEIVNLAFGLTLGALAVAFALAFGLGGRDAAGRQVEQWFARFRQ